MRRKLLGWFRKHRRDLPWRRTRDPYAIWVSEVMLQQTQIGTVLPFYERFLRAFPNINTLSTAPLEKILKLWSGLGYYRRARNLHSAAHKIATEYAGLFPRTLEQTRLLPGIGHYTAAAVLSMAYDVPLAALDGNVARVIARLDGVRGSLTQRSFRDTVQDRLDRMLSKRSPGDFNQALMELGQTVCLPRGPRCGVCPFRRMCRGRLQGKPEDYPSPRPRRSTERHYLAAAVVYYPNGAREPPHLRKELTQKRILMMRGLDDDLMEDLWNFPAAFGTSPEAAKLQLRTKLRTLGLQLKLTGPEIARVRHTVTYRDIEVRAYPAEVAATSGSGLRWIRPSQLHREAVSQLARKIARAIRSQPGSAQH